MGWGYCYGSWSGTANLRTKILDFRGFDSSRIINRGELQVSFEHQFMFEHVGEIVIKSQHSFYCNFRFHRYSPSIPCPEALLAHSVKPRNVSM